MAKVIFIGSDRNIFDENSAIRRRMLEYGSLFDELHIVVNTRKGSHNKFELSNKVFVHPTNSISRWLYPFDSKRIASAIINSSNDPKGQWVVSAQDPFENGLAALWICEKTGAKLHIQVHTDIESRYFKRQSLLNRLRTCLAARVLKRADGIRVVSERVRRSLAASHKYKLKVEPEILPIFSETKSQVEPYNFRGQHPGWKFVILMVGRLEPEKNYQLALRALKVVVEKYPQTGLAIIGEGRLHRRVKRQALLLGLKNNVAFLGAQPDAAPFFRGADLFLQTSNFEGYGMAMIEAAEAGLPIITTDVGAAGWLFKPNENALICGVKDKNCLVQSILKVMEDGALRERLRLWSRKALTGLSFDKGIYLEKYKNNILKCLSSKASS